MPPKARKAARSTQPRPARTLLALLLVMAVGAGLMLALGATSPRLGLDLAGGSQVTLIPRLPSGSQPSGTQLEQSVEIIRQRVNGLGVTEADVQTQGSNIVVSVPGATGDQALETIAQTALLRFRTVTQTEPVLPAGATAPAQPAQPGQPGAPGDSPPAADPGTTDPESDPTDPAADPGSSDPSAPPPVAGAPEPTAPAPDTTAPPAPTADPSAPVSPQAAVAPTPIPAPSAPAAPAPSAPEPSPLPELIDPNSLTGPDGAPETEPSEAVLAEYAALDCTLPQNRTGGTVDKPANVFIAACDQEGTEKFLLSPSVIEGTEIADATGGLRQGGTEYVVNLEFNGTGTRQFADVTTELAASGGRFAIVLDNVVVSAPGLNSGPILGGQAEITGNFTLQSAQDLAQVLKFGALPVTFDPGEVLQVSATVGGDQLDKGILAGLIGLLLVVVYSLLFYRALGLVSIASLVVAGALTYGVCALMGEAIGFALILAGVIGVIVSIGITADSFVVYFERVRDEIRDGRPIRVAVERAWPRARRTILVADSVTFLAALVLYFLSIGRVQNFAFTLGLTTLIDVLVVFFFTKPLVTLLVRRRFFRDGHRLSGLNPESIGAKPRRTGLKARVTAGATAGESA